MPSKLLSILVALAASWEPLCAQEADWNYRARAELRGNLRISDDELHATRFPFGPPDLPPGQSTALMETPDPGTHLELSVFNVQFDVAFRELFAAHAKVHFIDLYRRNPTSSDRMVDADELWVRYGVMPEILARPESTSFFVLAGKAPKMERQPVRLLESYGLAATSFNRFEDVQVMVGGTVGRNLYWRLVAANGNPVFMRDANALAGDNGTPELRERPPITKYGSGFPILYNAETEDLFLDNDHLQFGQALGYRWQREDQTLGFDVIVFHYRRSMSAREELTGTFYGGDLDLLDGEAGFSLPISGDRKEETGARVYAEWYGLTAIAQFTKQHLAGLQREGWEGEVGYHFPVSLGPVTSIQPAARLSGLTNRFVGAAEYPAPSVRWPWAKIDAGVRLGLPRGLDLTIEHTKHNVGSKARKVNENETLVTLRWRVG